VRPLRVPIYIEDTVLGIGSSSESSALPRENLGRLAISVGEGNSLALANLKLREILRNQSIRAGSRLGLESSQKRDETGSLLEALSLMLQTGT
jgi:hypothetical protein